MSIRELSFGSRDISCSAVNVNCDVAATSLPHPSRSVSSVISVVNPEPTAPPTSPRDDAETDLLLRFVHERDVRCPRCDYNLRNLTQPVCPECREELHLAVGQSRPKIHWLILAMAPGTFSGIAAFFMLGMIIMVSISPTGRMPWQPYVMDVFGWISGASAAAMFFRRWRFLKRTMEWQMSMAGVIWFVHIAFFLTMWALLR